LALPVPAILLAPDEVATLTSALSDPLKQPLTLQMRLHRNLPQPVTLYRTLVRKVVFLVSGIGILYGIISLAKVTAGGEFLQADEEARNRQKPLKCIDVNDADLGKRVKDAILPYPKNIVKAARAWLAIPRVIFFGVFPKRSDLDLVAVFVTQVCSFTIRTWVAVVIATATASAVVSTILFSIGMMAGAGARAGGASSSTSDSIIEVVTLSLEAYLVPRICDAMLIQRDQAMFDEITKEVETLSHASPESESRPADRFLVVVGAMHVNGILRRSRERPFGS
jgi:hypothetical protein